MLKKSCFFCSVLLLFSIILCAGSVSSNAESNEVRVLLSVSSDTAKSIEVTGSFTCENKFFSDGTLTAGVTKNGVALRHSTLGLLYEGPCARVERTTPDGRFHIENTRLGNTSYAGALELSVTPNGHVREVNCISATQYQAITADASLPPELQKAYAVIALTRAAEKRGSEKQYDVTDNDPFFTCKTGTASEETLALFSEVQNIILTLDGAPLSCRITEKNGGQTMTPKLLLSDDGQDNAYALAFDPYDLNDKDVHLTVSSGIENISSPLKKYFKKLLLQNGIDASGEFSMQSLTGYYSAAMLSGMELTSPKERAPQEAVRAEIVFSDCSGATRTETVTFPLYELVSNRVIRGGPYDTYFVHAESDTGPWHIVFANANGDRVGLSLTGAAEMARQGKSYSEILSFYYPGATISDVSPLQTENTSENDTSILPTRSDSQQNFSAQNNAYTSLPGDVNGDSVVDREDLKIIARFLLGLETLTQTRFNAADVDGDGHVTVNDLLEIKEKIYE